MLAQAHQSHDATQVDQVVRKVIEDVTGNVMPDIRLESDLVEDLGISSIELANIMNKIQSQLQIELSSQAKQEILEDAVSVQDMVEVIEEEYAF